MKLIYDDDLVEAVVFLCVTGSFRTGHFSSPYSLWGEVSRAVPPLQVRRFHAERERLYSILDPDERNAAFSRLHLSWFSEWGVERFLGDVLKSFPILPTRLNVLAFRKARHKSEEGGELYVNSKGELHGVVAIRPERFELDESLPGFLNHELTHISDMVDPSFGYSPEIRPAGQTVSQQRLIRERYRLLWDVTIDGRLTSANRLAVAGVDQRRAEFERAYNFLSDEKRARTFESLWTNLSPKHAELVSLASDPRELNSTHSPISGASCPLCGFATFHWADATALQPETVTAIQTHFRTWTPEQGACHRCIEIYESTAGLELPATICV